MMDVTYRHNWRGMFESLKLSKSAMKRVGINARSRMQKRLNKGYGVKGKLERYSKQYRNYKRRLGKNPEIVDMQDSGDMRNSLTVHSPSRNVVDIYPTLHSRIGKWHQTGQAKGGKVREWLGVSRNNEHLVHKDLDKEVSKRIRKWNRG